MRGTLVQAGHFIADKYRVMSVLGEGGMGVVYLAHHELLHKDVAVKVLTTAGDETARERFLREARAAAKLRSRHVVSVSDVGLLPDGELFLVMERLVGRDLDRIIREQGPMPVTMAVDVVLQVLDALAEAHHAGIVHRDLKPANIFLCEDGGTTFAKVLDFGISKTNRDELLSLTSTSSVMGSPLYMSPEQAKSSKAVDHRADIWSMGVVMFEALTGNTPFADVTIGGVFAKIYQEQAPFVSTLRGDVPPALSAIIARCLAKNPVERFRDCGELAAALAPFGSGTRAENVTRALSFAMPGGGTAVLSQPNPSRPQIGSNPQFPAHVAAGAQTADAWGHSQREIVPPKKSNGAVIALAALAGVLALTGLVLIGLFAFRSKTPAPVAPAAVVTTPSADPVPSASVAASSSPIAPVVSASASAMPTVPKPKPVSTAKKINDLANGKY